VGPELLGEPGVGLWLLGVWFGVGLARVGLVVAVGLWLAGVGLGLGPVGVGLGLGVPGARFGPGPAGELLLVGVAIGLDDALGEPARVLAFADGPLAACIGEAENASARAWLEVPAGAEGAFAAQGFVARESPRWDAGSRTPARPEEMIKAPASIPNACTLGCRMLMSPVPPRDSSAFR
jgi:hypothetical protein